MIRERIKLQEINSTNSFLRKHEPVGEDVLVVATAEYQSAGRGQGSNSWESQEGKNLLFSILANPCWLPLRKQFLLSMAGALALKETLDKYTDGISLKWPNDIYRNDKKISGTLIETAITGKQLNSCVFGIGLNVNQATFVSDAPNPVSLYNILGKETDREQLLDSILDSFEHYYLMLKNGGEDNIIKMYHQSLYRRQGLHEFIDKDGSFMAGIVEVKDNGHLVLKDTNNNFREYELKEIKWVL